MDFHEDKSKPRALRVGTLGSVDVWIHWVFLVLLAALLLTSLVEPSGLGLGSRLALWGIVSVALLISVVFHELGHLLTGRRLGLEEDRIVLWPVGGLLATDVPRDPAAGALTAAAGPLVNLALGAVVAGVCLAAGWSILPPVPGGEAIRPGALLAQWMVVWNVLLVVLNTLPCRPLDGGIVFESLLQWKLKNRELAASAAQRLGHIAAACALIVGLCIFFSIILLEYGYTVRHPLLANLSWGLLLLALLHFLEVQVGRRRLEEAERGEEDDGVFGYDFSQGYSSLEKTVTRSGRRASAWSRLREQRKERTRSRRHAVEAQEERRLDELLAKIHDQGMESISRQERRFLKRASRRYRR